MHENTNHEQFQRFLRLGQNEASSQEKTIEKRS